MNLAVLWWLHMPWRLSRVVFVVAVLCMTQRSRSGPLIRLNLDWIRTILFPLLSIFCEASRPTSNLTSITFNSKDHSTPTPSPLQYRDVTVPILLFSVFCSTSWLTISLAVEGSVKRHYNLRILYGPCSSKSGKTFFCILTTCFSWKCLLYMSDLSWYMLDIFHENPARVIISSISLALV